MVGNSKRIHTNQAGLHPNLEPTVVKHLESEFLKPYRESSYAAFHAIQAWRDTDKRLVLDSCCGNGDSTLKLAQQHPDCQILGVDKSLHRLGKHVTNPLKASEAERADRSSVTAHAELNYLLIRADIIDILRWLVSQQVGLYRHTIFYPNPWPKSDHLSRRWHGSPVFKHLLMLGGQLSMRSNWRLYLDEFQTALHIAGYTAKLQQLEFTSLHESFAFVSPFERKFVLSGHDIHHLDADLNWL